MFYFCIFLNNIVDISNLNVENVINMSYMFSLFVSFKNLNLNNFMAKNVKNMSGILDGYSSFTSMDIS